MRQFYYDTALSTGESAFASLNEVTDKSHILFGSDAHYAPNDWIAKMEKILKNLGILMKMINKIFSKEILLKF